MRHFGTGDSLQRTFFKQQIMTCVQTSVNLKKQNLVKINKRFKRLKSKYIKKVKTYFL